jgi:HPt (histidine-containing phosphotransfer) domain-containing protein
MDIDKLKNLLGNDEAMVNKFLRIFKDEIPRQLVQLEKALQRQDWKSVSTIAHGIKSQVKYLDLAELADTASRIEKAADNSVELEEVPDLFRDLEGGLKEVIANL